MPLRVEMRGILLILKITPIFCYFAKIRLDIPSLRRRLPMAFQGTISSSLDQSMCQKEISSCFGGQILIVKWLILAIRAVFEHFFETRESGCFTGVSGRWFGETGADSGLDWVYQRYCEMGKKRGIPRFKPPIGLWNLLLCFTTTTGQKKIFYSYFASRLGMRRTSSGQSPGIAFRISCLTPAKTGMGISVCQTRVTFSRSFISIRG